MVTKEMIDKLMDSDINNFIDMARRYHLDHIALEKFTNPEYFVEFNSDFILSHWDKISDFMRFNNVR
tara:strand:+ start:482 stop:682 length:201 start_codon:yes stop_codon:yes gene_type:complete